MWRTTSGERGREASGITLQLNGGGDKEHVQEVLGRGPLPTQQVLVLRKGSVQSQMCQHVKEVLPFVRYLISFIILNCGIRGILALFDLQFSYIAGK